MSTLQNEIDDVIVLIAENHPDYSAMQFKTEFEDFIGREPTLKEKQDFLRAAANVKRRFSDASLPSNSSLPSLAPKQTILLTSQVINGYTFGEVLAAGSYGEVYKCEKGGNSFAIKRIKDESKVSSEMEQYFASSVSARLKCPFLVRYFDHFRTTSGQLCIVMELCTKGDLRGRIVKLKDMGAVLSEESVMKFIIQMLIALYALHLAKFLHRDLKPENVFVDEKDNVKIGDVGCAMELDSTNAVAQTIVGNPAYKSPEIFKGEEYNASAEMWALGVLLYELVMLEHPFRGGSVWVISQAICAGVYAPIPKGRCPAEVATIIVALLNLDPHRRPTARELLQNPFIRMHAASLMDPDGKSLLSYLPPAPAPAPTPIRAPADGMFAGVSIFLRDSGVALSWPTKDDCYKGAVVMRGAVQVPHGQGRCVFNGGSIYPKDTVYEGNWLNGKMEGKGSLMWANGDKYIGEFKNDVRDGKGIFAFVNGDKYVGNFKNGEFNGQGELKNKVGEIVYSGQWKDGKQVL